MQPYFFPYIGYFQLMHAVEAFVFLDDVQYIYGGWINRNRIPIAGKPIWLTLPLKNSSHKLSINQREYLLGPGVAAVRRKLQAAYPKATASSEWKLVDGLLGFPEVNVAKFNANLLCGLADELGIRCDFLSASSIAIERDLRGQDRIIAICKRLGATHYVNPIGGAALYSEGSFLDAGIRLSFLRTGSAPSQTEQGPLHLSVIDRLFSEGVAAERSRLAEFSIHSPASFSS